MRTLSSAVSSLLNAAAYQLGWFACVLGAAGGWGTTGAAVALALALGHLLLSQHPDREWPLLLAAAGLGLVVDSLHSVIGILQFEGAAPGGPAPLWIVALWLQFGTVFHFCMRWLSRRYLLAGLLGMIGGPLSFLAGERLGAATFGEPRWLALAVLALSWSLALPALVRLADFWGWEGRYRRPSLSVRAST